MDITEQLKAIGFTLNEARAYVALLQHQPVSAYEIAKQAGMPTSKIYETVARLVQRGVLLAQLDDAGQQVYAAISPADLMNTIRSRTESQTRSLQRSLESLPQAAQSDLIWPLSGAEGVQTQVTGIIDAAESTVLVSLWPEELTWCEPPLRQAVERGVQVALVHFGEPTISIGATYHHPAEKTLYAEKGGRGLTVVGDSSKVVIANFQTAADQQEEKVEGAWSRNPSFVTVAEDYVKHDVYITKVTRFLGPEVTKRFGEDYSRLRDIFDADA